MKKDRKKYIKSYFLFNKMKLNIRLVCEQTNLFKIVFIIFICERKQINIVKNPLNPLFVLSPHLLSLLVQHCPTPRQFISSSSDSTSIHIDNLYTQLWYQLQLWSLPKLSTTKYHTFTTSSFYIIIKHAALPRSLDHISPIYMII